MSTRMKVYWLVTALLALDVAVTGAAALWPAPFVTDALQRLGYPAYFASILGSWKILAALALLAPARPRLKEWAYAGLGFELTGAAASHLLAGDSLAAVLPPVCLLGVVVLSWALRPESRRLASKPAASAGEPARRVGPANALAVSTSALLLLAAGSSSGCAAPKGDARSAQARAPQQATAPAPKPRENAAAVVAFWREAGPAMWFAKDPEFDRRFRERFLALHEAAARGELESWLDAPESALALLILLDQFPRNAFRDTPRMYATDALARSVADRALRAGHDHAIDKPLRLFMYLPFGHSEDLADQERSVLLSEQLGEPSLSHAKGHRDIVRRFGRFPHRNPILGRPMLPEEQKFLDEGGFKG